MCYGVIVVDGSGHMGRAPEGGWHDAAHSVHDGVVIEFHVLADLLSRPTSFSEPNHLSPFFWACRKLSRHVSPQAFVNRGLVIANPKMNCQAKPN